MDTETVPYKCPRCGSSHVTLRGLKDHLDDAHFTSNKGARLKDWDQKLKDRDFIQESHYRPVYADKMPKESDEVNRQLLVAREMELRHLLFFRQMKSQDDLKIISEEISTAKKRQLQMSGMVQNTREQIEDLQKSADRVTAEQKLMIEKLRDQVYFKDSQVEKSMKEIYNLTEDRHKLQQEVFLLSQDKAKNEEQIMQLEKKIKEKTSGLEQKER